MVAMSLIALYVGSPACRLGTVADGGCLSNCTMSVAVCRRKSSSVIFGMGTMCGKNFTVSTCLSALVCGKNKLCTGSALVQDLQSKLVVHWATKIHAMRVLGAQ